MQKPTTAKEEEDMATEEDNQHHDVVAIDLPAPEGWTKKFTPKKGGTPQRNDIVFVSPTGEEIKSRKQLDQYLKSHPGGPAASEFEWSTGDTPRRSARLSEKTKAVVAHTSQSPKKKQKRSGKKQPQEKNDAGVAEEEATGEKDATAEETLESSTVDAKETTDKDVEMKTDTEETDKATTVEPDAKIEESKADERKTESSEPSAKADEPKEESSEPSVKADEPSKEPSEPEAKSEEAKEATNGGEEAPEGKVDSAVTEGLEEKAVEKEAEAASLQGPTTGS